MVVGSERKGLDSLCIYKIVITAIGFVHALLKVTSNGYFAN